jgi:alpha-beta hydrolase superfamily lysophospholipase
VTLPPLDGLDDWLSIREAQAPALRPDCEKRVIWADGPRRTAWSVVYIHGFSASRRELSPYPERVAEALGANYFGARLTGHGQEGSAMDRATLPDWMDDTAEALAIGRALGERVIAISCSTGSTLLTLALAEEERIAGAVMVSPNYGLRLRRLQAVLDAPLSAIWVPLLVKGPQGPPAANSQTGIWSSGYTVKAYAPMGQAMRAVRRADLGGIRTPALFAYSDADQVVDPGLSAAVMRRWGAPVRRLDIQPGPDDDPMAHVLAGDALSPGQTEGIVRATLDWVRTI